MGTACWPALARGTSERCQASKIWGCPNRPLFLKARHRQCGPEWASSGQTGLRSVCRGRISRRQNTTRLRKWTAPFHQRETGYSFGPHSSSTNPALQSHSNTRSRSKLSKTLLGFFSYTSFLIILPYTNTIFICSKIRDYLAIFRCSTRSESGQGCLYTFEGTSKLSCWLLFHICQGWDFVSNSNTSCRWREV